MGSIITWSPNTPDLPPPKLQLRTTDNILFRVHDSLLLPQSLALHTLLGDMTIEDQSEQILPINISSSGLKLILHFVYNNPRPKEGWKYTPEPRESGVSLETIKDAALACQQYMMITVAAALEGPLRANMKANPILAASIAHIPVMANEALCEDVLRMSARSATTFVPSGDDWRASLPSQAVDLLYRYRDDSDSMRKRQEVWKAAKVLAVFKVEHLIWDEYESYQEDGYISHSQSCKHWLHTASSIKHKATELLLDLLREKASIKRTFDVEADIGGSINTRCSGCRELVAQNLRRLAVELSVGERVDIVNG